MKHIVRIIVLAVAFVAGLTTVSAQTVQVLVTQKVSSLPVSATNYIDDPFRYFDIKLILTGAGAEGLDIFFDMDFSVNTGEFYIRTKPGKSPSQSIHISEGVNVMKKDVLLDHIKGRKETNIDFSHPVKAQLLPEGTYQLCMDIYQWGDWDRTDNLSVGACPTYEICYSGSAPELVSPLAGAQLALSGAQVVVPTRKVNFFWTPVISNCSDKNTRFKYQLKVVKVLRGQNYQDAIKHNPVAFSAEVQNGNLVVFDTLRDIKVHMERGALYVAQVQATQIKSSKSMETFIVANGGKSQPMFFYWDFPDYDYFADDESEEGDDGDGVSGLTQWEGGVEEVSELDEIIEEAFPDEQTLVLYPKRHYVESNGYSTIPMTDDIEVGFVPISHESLRNVTYDMALYDYADGDIESITANDPLLSENIEIDPDDETDGQELISRTLAGWGTKLKKGNLYYLQLTNSFEVDYWNYSIADTSYYVNEMLAEHFHDTISRDFVEAEMEYSEGVFFQWGDDPDAPDFMTPQWTSPVDRTLDDTHDPENYEIPASIPEVRKATTFPVSWTPVRNVAFGDEVEYEVNVYVLKSGQTLEEAILENDAIVSRTVTDVNEISKKDADFFKAFSPRKTYVMTLNTTVNGDSDTLYHFTNGSEAMPIVFKVVK